MYTRRFVHMLRWLCVLSVFAASSAHADPLRVLVVSGKGVSAEALGAIETAVAADAEALDPREYQRLARGEGLLPTSDAALERVAPRVQAQLIIVALKTDGKLQLIYRDGASGEVLRKDRLRERQRARLKQRVGHSVRRALAAAAPRGVAQAVAIAPEPIAPEPVPASAAQEATPDAEPDEPAADDEDAPEPASARFAFEVSAGPGGAMRQIALPTRMGVRELDTGLFAGVALGLSLAAPLGSHALLRAAVDYRTSLGLQGAEKQRETQMSTPLRSHAVGFGIAPGYRFGAVDSVSVLLHLGWYFRGLRPIAQLALPEVSWHAAVIRPELNVPLADGAVTFRLAPELLFIAGLYTTLPDASGLARSGMGYGGEASVDVRVVARVSLRVEYRESHAVLRTAWAQNLTDIERFAAVRVVLQY